MLIGLIVALICFQTAFWINVRYYRNDMRD